MNPAQSSKTMNGPLCFRSTGKDVATLQQLLNSAIPPGGLRVDGIFGMRTDTALREFQRRKGLKPDGIAGPLTAQALGVKYSGKSAAAPAPVRLGTPLPSALQTPLETVADALTEELKTFCDALKQDIRNSGASETVTQKAIEAIDDNCFGFAKTGLKEWARYAASVNPEFASMSLSTLLLDFDNFVGQVGLYVKEKGQGKMARLAERMDSLDVEAIQRIVRLLLVGSANYNLTAALWDLHQVMRRAVGP